MSVSVCLLCLLSVLCLASLVSSDTKKRLNIVGEGILHLRKKYPGHYKQKTTEIRKKRSVSQSEEDSTVKTINDLRRSVGASGMPYLKWSFSGAADAANWTQYCNYNDATLFSGISGYYIKLLSSDKPSFPTKVQEYFVNPKFSTIMKSVRLTGIGADFTYCSQALFGNRSEYDVYLSVVLLTGDNFFNFTIVQYTIGEACTQCLNGNFWCDYGLCRADCSSSISTCFCYPDCANCADYDRNSCTCQCPSGWSGSRCENAVSSNSKAPTCTTKPRTPVKYITTTSTAMHSKTSATTTRSCVMMASSLLMIFCTKNF